MGYGQIQEMRNDDAGVMYGGHGAHPTAYYSIDDASRVVPQGGGSTTYYSIEQENGYCQATGTSSFVRISQEITGAHLYSEEQWHLEEESTMARLSGRPGTNPMGQYTPIGDGVPVMLLLAGVTAVGVWLRQRKTRMQKRNTKQ